MSARLPKPGGDSGDWGAILNAYLEVSLNTDGSLKSSAITSAGAYKKPSSGIPSTDLSSSTQAELALASSAVQIGGDLGGTITAPIVAKLNSVTLNIGTPSNSQVLSYDSTSNQWVAATISSSVINDATTSSKGIVQLAGDLGGTAAAPTVAKLNGITAPGSAPSTGQVLTATSSSATAWSTPASAPVTSVAGKTGAVTLVESDVANLISDLGGKLTAANNLSDVVSASSARTNLGLGTAATISSTAGGDLSGTLPSPTVAKINGITAPASAPSGAGQVLTSTSTTASSWQTPSSAPVSSVFSRTGAVTAQTGDYTASQVGALPSTDDLSAIATANATSANVSLNSHKITNLANGSASSDAATFGQIPTAGTGSTNFTVGNATMSGDLSGTLPSPTVAKVNGVSVSGTPSSGQVITATSSTASSWSTPFGPATALTITQKTTSYTFQASDAGTELEYTDTSAGTFTIPQSVFSVGQTFNVRQANTGRLTIAAGSGVTMHTPNGALLAQQWSTATIICRASNEFVLNGDTSTT